VCVENLCLKGWVELAGKSTHKELGLAHIIEGRTFTAPAFAGGRVYARNTKGDVVSVDMRGK
jgi:acyl dehydratase